MLRKCRPYRNQAWIVAFLILKELFQASCDDSMRKVPSRPTIITFDPTTQSQEGVGLFVAWTAPQSECPITSYKLRYKISSNTSWSKPVSVLPPLRNHDLRELSPNTSYDIRVRAVSSAGLGNWSDVVQVMTYEAPGPVRSLSATPIAVNGVPALSIRWSPPVDKAQGGLTYRLRVVPPRLTISRPVTATEYNMTGLRANTSYIVYVRAVSSAVYGPEVSAVNSTGKKLVPKIKGARVTRTVQGSSPALRVSWSAVSGSGINYTVCYSTNRGAQSDPPSGANCSTSGITGTSTTLGPLNGNTTYHIWVRAESSGGQGPYSDRVQETTYDAPGPVTSLLVRPSTTKYGLVITWGPPSGSNYPTPVTYRVRYRERPSSGPPGSWSSSVVRSATQREYTTPTLKPGTRYEVEVWAVTSIEEGTRGRKITTTYQAAGNVTSLQVRPSNTIYGLVITWGTPSGSNYPTPVTYRVRYRERPSSGPPGSWSGTVVRSATQREYTTPTLKPGTRYEVAVSADTGIEEGTRDTQVATTYQVAGVVTSLQVRPSTTIYGLVITWGPPSGSNYPTPVTYRVRYRERPSSGSHCSWSSPLVKSATQREYTTPTLKPGTRYEVEVWAVTSIEEGTYTTKTASTYKSPGPVTSLQVEPYNTTSHGLVITWGPPSGRNYPTPVTYQLRYRERPSSGPPGSWNSTVVRSATQREYTTPILKPGPIARYEVEVWAVTSIGEGTRERQVVTTYQCQVSPTPNYSNVVVGGVFIGGIAVGAVTVLLVVEIVCGVCKLRRHPQHSTSTETSNKVDSIYEAVDEGPSSDVTMTTSPAYEGVKIY